MTGAEEVTYYGISGQRMGTYTISAYADGAGGHMQLTVQTMSGYFGSRVIRKGGNNDSGGMSWSSVQLDRLSSVGKYYPYGEDRGGGNPGNGTDKFATYFRDTESGLDYAVNRYYNSAAGRFLSPDPYKASAGPGNPGSWNRYGYVEGDPANRFDPLGTCWATVAIAGQAFTEYFPCDLPYVAAEYGRRLTFRIDGVSMYAGDSARAGAKKEYDADLGVQARRQTPISLRNQCYIDTRNTIDRVRADVHAWLADFWSVQGTFEAGLTKGGILGALEGAASGSVWGVPVASALEGAISEGLSERCGRQRSV